MSLSPTHIADGSATFTTTPAPAQLMYEASVKFVEVGSSFTLPVRGTREYKELQTRDEGDGGRREREMEERKDR